jgi:hypothetical protein
MPQPKKTAKARRGAVKNVQIDQTIIDAKENEKLEKALSSRDQAPTASEVTPSNDDWKRFSTTLGPPFDSERITLKQCRQIRKDPMVAFGLHYIKVPIARANWLIDARDKNGPNAQVAAFIDAALRKIYARYVFQRTQALDFGYKAQVKRFILENPGGVYRESAAKEADPLKRIKPIWDEGNILPYIWKPPVGLKPELVTPRFVESGPKAGEFDGMVYEVPAAQRTKAMGFKAQNKKGSQAGKIIDVFHALWGTNQKDEEDGSIYGYPRVAYARDYWWAYRMLYGFSNRAYERLAIPPVIARYPIGTTVIDDISGERLENQAIALEMAERIRSNAVAAVPSTMQTTGMDASATNVPEWDFKFMETPTEALTVFDARFNYLNVMKLRSIWVPEQAFIEGAGGQSSRNVASQMAQIFEASQLVMMEEIAAEINAYMIPQLLVVNFPEFINNGGRAEMKTHGFKPEDLEFYKQILQLIGQGDPAKLADIDVIELLDRINVPLKDPRDYEIEQQNIAQNLANQGPPLVNPTPTAVGTIANPNVNPGQNNGGSVPEPNPPGTLVAGFSDAAQPYIYMQPQETYNTAMMFADPDTDNFLASLPSTKHYADKTLRALSLQLRRLWQGHFRRLYPELAGHVAKIDDFLVLADSEPNSSKRVTKKQAETAAKKILNSFSISSDVMEELRLRSASILAKMGVRAANLDLRKLKRRDVEIEDNAWENWLEEQTGRLLKFTDDTFRSEMRVFLVNNIREGKTGKELADEIAQHFSGFPVTKADRIARSETRDAVNAGTLIASEAAGISYLKARDGEEFDEDCKERNGTLLTVKEAWKEMRKEHSYGTLGFDPIPRLEFSVKNVRNMPDDVPDGAAAFFDNEKSVAYVLADIPEKDAQQFLMELSDWLMKQEYEEAS